MRTHLPKRYLKLSKNAWPRYRYYKEIKDEAEYYRPHFIPDLSEFYGEDREIIAYEIEDKCLVDDIKLETINFWIGVTMDGWDQWDLMLIITNRFGRGWDVLLNTKKDLQQFWLNDLRKNRNEFLRFYPDLDTEGKIIEATTWRNFPRHSVKDFPSNRSEFGCRMAVDPKV